MTMATRNREPWSRTRAALVIAGQALLLTVCAALAYVYVLAADALINPPEPELRCFQTAAEGTYCRTQGEW